jgi:hypothetical protein
MSATHLGVTPDTIKAAAPLADLALSDDRAAAVAGLLAVWVPAANALSTRMQAEDLRGLTPATTFTGSVPAGGRAT